jgi:hypothetical protein
MLAALNTGKLHAAKAAIAKPTRTAAVMSGFTRLTPYRKRLSTGLSRAVSNPNCFANKGQNHTTPNYHIENLSPRGAQCHSNTNVELPAAMTL